MSHRFFIESTSGLTALGAFDQKPRLHLLNYPGPGQEYIVPNTFKRDSAGGLRLPKCRANVEEIHQHTVIQIHIGFSYVSGLLVI